MGNGTAPGQGVTRQLMQVNAAVGIPPRSGQVLCQAPGPGQFIVCLKARKPFWKQRERVHFKHKRAIGQSREVAAVQEAAEVCRGSWEVS